MPELLTISAMRFGELRARGKTTTFVVWDSEEPRDNGHELSICRAETHQICEAKLQALEPVSPAQLPANKAPQMLADFDAFLREKGRPPISDGTPIYRVTIIK